MHPLQKQTLVDLLNNTLETQLFLLRTDINSSSSVQLILEDYYVDMNYRQRNLLGATTEFEDWFHCRKTKTLPSQT